MADENPNSPSGGVPPKPADAPKVQPKKETVRISLPPKPASTATIRLPTLPAGGKPPAATTTPGAAAAPKAAMPTGAPPPPKPPATAAPVANIARPVAAVAAAPAVVTKPAPVATAPPRPAPAAARKKTGPLDTGLAIAAGVLGLGAVASLLLLLTMK